MNQAELNKAGEIFILNQTVEVARKIDSTLTEDLTERINELPGTTIHHVHNMALFYAVTKLNSLFQLTNDSKESMREYMEHAESLKTRFLDIVDSLKDFQPKDNGPVN